ncbi:hypothetical protein Tco_1579023, partial [Tanacetum coccineum]
MLKVDQRRSAEMRELRTADRTRQQQLIQTLTVMQSLQGQVQRIENKAKRCGRYEVLFMSGGSTRWQAEVSVRGVCQYEVRVRESVPIMGNNEAVGRRQKDQNTLRSCIMSGG